MDVCDITKEKKRVRKRKREWQKEDIAASSTYGRRAVRRFSLALPWCRSSWETTPETTRTRKRRTAGLELPLGPRVTMSRRPGMRLWPWDRQRTEKERKRERERRRHGYFGLAQIERERKSDREIERRNCDSIFYYCVVGMVGLVYIYIILGLSHFWVQRS